MNTQHTPGPWAARCYLRPDLDDDPMGVYAVETADDALTPRYYAAEPETDELDAVHAENEANARLIAAAPDLLAALKEMKPYLERQIKFLRYQRVGREFWPNREEAEGCLGRTDRAIAKAEEGRRGC